MGGSMQLAFALGLLFVYKGLAARSGAFNPDDSGDDEFAGSADEDGFDEDESGAIGRADSDAQDDEDDDGFGASPSFAKSPSSSDGEESGAIGRVDSHAGDDGDDDRFVASPSPVESSSGSMPLQPMDLVYFAKDGIMSLNPKRKKGQPERLSRYKAGQLGQIRKVVGSGRYIVCVGQVERTRVGALGLNRKDKQGTKCPGGEVELGESDLKAKTETMEVWDDKAQDVKVKVVDVFGVGQRVKVLRSGKIKSGKAWARNTEGVVSQVLKGNKYMVCVGGKLRNNLGRILCTGAGFVSFPAYQLQKLHN